MSSQIMISTPLTNWWFGPASLWYDAYQPNLYIFNKKSSKNNKVKTFCRHNKALWIVSLTHSKGRSEQNRKRRRRERSVSQCNAINLNLSIEELNSDMFLLVNTMNWENNFIVEASQAKTTGSELINKRIKYAGWVPSCVWSLTLSRTNRRRQRTNKQMD